MKKRKLLKKEIWKKEGRKGFSLGEVLLTVAILGILAAIAVPSIGYFSRLLNQMKLDNTAREIFISAQNKMITMKSCGMDLPDGTSMGLDAPADYDADVMGNWPNRGTDDSIHPFRYVFSADAAFMEDTLLGKDKQEGKYVIEFNRNTGDVYAVFYWEPQEVDFGGKSSFVYASPNNTYTEGDKTYRIREDKKERMNSGLKVGYYGGNAAAMTKAEEFAYDAKIINADKLQLRLMPEDEELGEHTRYVITIRSATDTENKEEYTFGLQYDGSTTTQSVTFEATGAIKEIVGTLPKNVEALHDVSKKERGFLITLDSVEEGQHFANLFPKIAAGDDISIQVQAYYLGTDKVCIAKQNYELTDNSLFARVRQETEKDGVKINPQGKDVVITTGRHLQNLSEKASHLGYITDKNNNQAQTKTKYPIVHAKLNANIDWTNEAYNYSEKNTLYDGKELLESFQPIDISNESKIDTRIFDGNGRTISNLSITEPAKIGSTTAAGLFGIVKDDLTIQDLKLRDCTVNTTDVSDTGMLVGRVEVESNQTVSIQNCGVFLSDKTKYKADEYQVENVAEKNQSSNVGGFVGNMQKGNLKIQDSFSAVNVRSTAKSLDANASGFVGLANGKISIENSYTSCKVDAEGKTGASAGGLAGKINGDKMAMTANNCFTTSDVSAGATSNCYSGGAFGNLNCGGTLANIRSYGLVLMQGGNKNSQIGGFIGRMGTATKPVTCTNCTYLSMQDYNDADSVNTNYDVYAPSSSYDDMPKGTAANEKLTFAYLAALKDEPFPFALMKKKDSNENLPYYGNWPAPAEDAEGVVGLCYYEKYGENDYGVFISGVDMAKKGSVYVDTLVYEPTSTKRVQESGYCIAAKGKGISALNDYTSLASLPSLAGYQFYQLADSTPNTAGVCRVSLNGVSFYYQPDFAAAISKNAGKYASDLAAYQVRTEEQLAKVGAYKGYTFHQTMNIDIETINRDSLIAEIPAATTLDGQGSHFNGKAEVSPAAPYTITMETALPDENVGLIGSNQGTLKNLVLEGQTDNSKFLVVQNEGTMENCIANHADVVMQRAENP